MVDSTMKKRFWVAFCIGALALACALALPAPYAAAAEGDIRGQCGDGVEFLLSEEAGTLTLTGAGPTYDYGYTDPVPWREYQKSIKTIIVNEGVTALGSTLFADSVAAQSVTLPSSLESIGAGAFSDCGSIATMHIPEKVETIGDGTFAGTVSLEGITVENGNVHFASDGKALYSADGKTLYAYAAGNSGTAYSIEEGTESIKSSAFVKAGNLNSITLPSSLVEIGEEALSRTAITAITIPSSVQTIDEDAFLGCDKLEGIEVEGGNQSFYSTDGVLFTASKELLFYPSNSPLVDYQVPDGTQAIKEHAFIGAKKLTSITFPDSVTMIDGYAFLYCENLREVKLTDNVTLIGEAAFMECTSLSTINLPQGLDVLSANAFADCKALKDIALPEGMTRIGDQAFAGSGLERISPPDSITSIGNRAFEGCPIGSIILPKGLKEVGDKAFVSCLSLVSVDTSKCTGLEAIGESAFDYCISLKSFTIPASLTDIGDMTRGDYNVFTCCYALEEFSVDQGNALLQSIDGVLYTKEEGNVGLVCYPLGKGLASYELPSITKYVGNFAIYNQPIPSEAPEAVQAALQSMMPLTSLTVPSSVRAIGQSALSNEKLQTVYVLYDKAVAIDDFAVGDDAFMFMAEGSVIYCLNKDSYDVITEQKYSADRTTLVLMQAIGGSLAIQGGEHPLLGDALQANVSGITPIGATYAYSWSIDGVVVSDQAAYTVPNESRYLGKTVMLTVKGTGGFYGELTVASNPIAAPAPGPTPTPTPSPTPAPTPAPSPLPVTGDSAALPAMLLGILSACIVFGVARKVRS